ncbi:MAG: nucleotidyltransferase domain-containing protein [Desulfobulbaceae bacterium]|nr:nucleotidyltransferase domain-containing protein [Desulfobulbaceae bacterium]
MKYIAKLRKVLTGAEEAYLFGSYANNTADEYSDLDILVVKKTKIDFFHRFKEVPGLYELGVPIDLLFYTPDEFAEMKKIRNPLIENIVRNGQRII